MTDQCSLTLEDDDWISGPNEHPYHHGPGAFEDITSDTNVEAGCLTEAYVNGDDEDDPFFHQLTNRMGNLKIAEDGQLRFFGATSNLHMVHKGPLSVARSHFRSSSEEGMQMLEAARVSHHVPVELEDHLLKLYFCWEDPSIHIVNEDWFWRERARFHTQSEAVTSAYSPSLASAMCAFGAAFTSRPCPDLPEDLADFFATKAKILLDAELDAPRLCSIQALVILSAVEASLARDARGWLTSGMAVRLALDQGLHQNPQRYVDAGIVDSAEAALRVEIWGGVYLHERMWSLYIGRPSALDDRQITVPLPIPHLSTEPVRMWSPYTDNVEASEMLKIEDPFQQVIAFNILLASKMNKIREAFYADSPYYDNGVNGYQKALEIHADLQAWYASLPDKLKPETTTSDYHTPHVLQLK